MFLLWGRLWRKRNCILQYSFGSGWGGRRKSLVFKRVFVGIFIESKREREGHKKWDHRPAILFEKRRSFVRVSFHTWRGSILLSRGEEGLTSKR